MLYNITDIFATDDTVIQCGEVRQTEMLSGAIRNSPNGDNTGYNDLLQKYAICH